MNPSESFNRRRIALRKRQRCCYPCTASQETEPIPRQFFAFSLITAAALLLTPLTDAHGISADELVAAVEAEDEKTIELFSLHLFLEHSDSTCEEIAAQHGEIGMLIVTVTRIQLGETIPWPLKCAP